MANAKLKCHRCPECRGFGCLGELPGLGGVFESQNFQLNCQGWENLREKAASTNSNALEKIQAINYLPQNVRCGPVTGAVENIGYAQEKDFYYPYLKKAYDSGFGLCVGDGCPDEKLQYGIEAVKSLGQNAKAAFFLKPYPDEKLAERVKWVQPYAEYIGIDIDSYNIITMRKLVNLERKTPQQLMTFRKSFDVPFVIKGVFTKDDIELVKQVKPDVVYISNHGGRVETRIGSTADFLAENAQELKKYCSQIWVDGGIRSRLDIQTAIYYGADKAIIARPFIRATFDEQKIEL
ncbi:MAG: alpha-hydroxy-acid oxidizing protein [Treponema sp.]|nr:alpha-hydroxy-acid oxidizing protein [Treponema sp.]